jgi:secreted PhoX family phosphatase
VKRRGFLLAGSVAGLSTGLALWLRSRNDGPTPSAQRALVADPKGVLALRPGFRYRVIEQTGQRMDDGFRVPGRPDAMGCFALPNGQWALMRNHELDNSLFQQGPYTRDMPPPKDVYDPRSVGGVTRVLLDARGQRLRSNLVLMGTSRNCAGGMSPWGWLTCEESVDDGHGYVFLCATDADRIRPPRRIPAYGRFLHEAVAIDPDTHAAYLTEDRGDGCLYRFLPSTKNEPFGAGQLQALGIVGSPRLELGRGVAHDKSLPIYWIDVPAEAGERDDALRYEAQKRGAAVVRRGEGIWPFSDGFVITCTSGGPKQAGQIFHLLPKGDGGELRLLIQSEDAGTLDMPDNITLTPWGDLMVCEDNMRNNHLHVVTRQGAVLPFANNVFSQSELAGVCFSPDGRVLFVNMQTDGLTLAIEGPFDRLA